MKISIVIAEGVKQVMMTPETDHEKQALKFISPGSEAKVAYQRGTYDDSPTHYSHNTKMCRGGYLRRFAEKDSLMFVFSDLSSSNSDGK